jgi:hypothetical protein
MMGILMPKTCWAVSVRQSNEILRLIVASSWVFYLSDRRCTEPQPPPPPNKRKITNEVDTCRPTRIFERIVSVSAKYCFSERMISWGIVVQEKETGVWYPLYFLKCWEI